MADELTHQSQREGRLRAGHLLQEAERALNAAEDVLDEYECPAAAALVARLRQDTTELRRQVIAHG